MKTTFPIKSFLDLPIIGILRGVGPAETKGILRAYGAAGLKFIEITLNTPRAFELIKEHSGAGGTELCIGAGTVCNPGQLEMAIEAGARFIVTPILDIPIIKRCKELGIPVFPGAYSPTEVYRAWEAGATMVKVFPAAHLGPDYIRQLKAPLDQIKLMPTGGVGLHNMEEYLQAGADGFGLGSALFPSGLLQAGDWVALQRHIEQYVAFWKHKYR